MAQWRASLTMRNILRSDFAWAWCGVAAVALLDIVLCARMGFDLAVTWRDFALAFAAFGAVAMAHVAGSRRFSLVAEYFTLTLLATVVFAVLSYLAMAVPGPLFDARLLAADRVLGFDWLAGFHWLEAHPAASGVLQFVYNSLVYQGLYFGVLLGLMQRRDDLRKVFWIVFVAGLLTSAGAALFPAFGPYKTFGLESQGAFLPDMERLRAHDLHFALAKLTGVVSFPSFHTTMALIYAYAFRRTGVIGWAMAGLNLAMLVSIPYFGGHYLTDMIAGAGVMLASVGIVAAWPRLIAVRRLVLVQEAAR
ncbi:MAG TPA: phosphatase PAP2 family protein [Rhizomicrobium sp.]